MSKHHIEDIIANGGGWMPYVHPTNFGRGRHRLPPGPTYTRSYNQSGSYWLSLWVTDGRPT